MLDGPIIHFVMRSFRAPRRGDNGIPRRQVIRLYGPLDGMITPKDLPRELWGFKRISIGTCPTLAKPENQALLRDATLAFKTGGIAVEHIGNSSPLQRDTWKNITGKLAALGITDKLAFTFHFSGNKRLYLHIDIGNGRPLSRRLFLGRL